MGAAEKSGDSYESEFRKELEAFADTPHGDEDETVWLLSYADLMTLLFTFFVMLYSSVMIDDSKTLRQSLAAYLQGDGDSNSVSTGESSGSGNTNLNDISNALSARIEEEQLLKDVNISIQKNGLNIAFSSSLLFDTASAELKADSRKTMKEMIAIIKEKGPKLKIRVEGHTDDTPVTQKSRFRSNWELSGARASHIITMFESMGFPTENLLAIGYGSSRPLLPNRNPAGERDIEAQRRNRRVVLTVYDLPKENPTK
jgi:chemotaxis protein MotB